MKKFSKGKLTTWVDDNDPRITEYKQNGWTEDAPDKKVNDELDDLFESAINDANESEAPTTGESTKPDQPETQEAPPDAGEPAPVDNPEPAPKPIKAKAPDKKVNDAIKAKLTAAAESEAVDDGLMNKEAN